jgi:hypothetical protein
MCRRLLLLLAAGALLAGCADDAGEASTDEGPASTTSPTTTTTEPVPVDTTFLADDVERLCDDLEGLRDIDPDADPRQGDVDRLRAIAETAPPGVAEPLLEIADFGQAVIDSGGEPPPDAEELRTQAADAATLLIAYGNEACDIDVPLFNSIAGV